MKTLMLSFALAAIAATTSGGYAATTPPAVHIKDDAFFPTTLTVHPGDTVVFINDDDDAHTVTAANGSFDSKGLDTHQQWKYTFTKAGSYAFFCELHPFMKGTIVVKAATP
jgi:plastocyanin